MAARMIAGGAAALLLLTVLRFPLRRRWLDRGVGPVAGAILGAGAVLISPVFVVFAAAPVFLWRRRRLGGAALAAVLAGGIAAILAPWSLPGGDSGPWRPMPAIHPYPRAVVAALSGHPLLAMGLLLALLALAAYARARRRGAVAADRRASLLAGVVLVQGGLIAAGAAWPHSPAFILALVASAAGAESAVGVLRARVREGIRASPDPRLLQKDADKIASCGNAQSDEGDGRGGQGDHHRAAEGRRR
jgi:hypothetical protein